MDIGKTERVVLAHAKEIGEAQTKHPEIARAITAFVDELDEIFIQLRKEIQQMEAKTDQELAKVLVINNIYKITDQVFL